MKEEKTNIIFKTQDKETTLIHEIKGPQRNINGKIIIMIITVLVVSFGVFTGYYLASKREFLFMGDNKSPKIIKSKKLVGSTDKKTFRDVAEGRLEKGGIDGEGTHHLVRPGGESQNVYLTSSVINLDDYVGKKVRVWGETFAAQKAGWLMDVGRIEEL